MNSLPPPIFGVFRTICLLILTSWVTSSHAQMPILSIGNETVNLQSGIVEQALPTPPVVSGFPDYYVYDGSLPKYHQHVQFNELGEVLFFIQDGMIYDGDGYLILPNSYVTGNQDFPDFEGCHEVAISLVPGSCSKYFIFYSRLDPGNQGSQRSEPHVLVLDMLQPNDLWSAPQLGRVIKSIDDTNFINAGLIQYHAESYPSNEVIEYSNDHYSQFLIPGDGSNKEGHVHMDISVSQGNSSFTLALADNSEVTLMEFSETGIVAGDSYEWAPNYTQRNARGEIEIRENGGGLGYDVAWTNSSGNGDDGSIIVSSFNAALNHVSNVSVPINATQNENHIYGIEYSPNGDYLYYSANEPDQIGYIDLATNTKVDLSSIVPNVASFAESKIESNYDALGQHNAIIFGGSLGLGRLSNVNQPGIVTWAQLPGNVQVPAVENIASPDFQFYHIHGQNYNIEVVANTLTSADCCKEVANVSGEIGFQVTTSNDGTWNVNNNPFGNTSGVIRMADDLVFESGTETTIDGLTFEFDTDAQVIIEPGAYVRLTNGTVWTALCDLMWPGVDLQGTTNATSSIDQAPMIGGDQGYLRMDDSMIEHARTAVKVGSTSTNAGGIIRAYDSVFRNNEHGVDFSPYHYIAGNDLYVSNKSLFYDTQFITDDALNYAELLPQFHIRMTEVDRLNIQRCSFINSTPYTIHEWDERGSGIIAIKSSFRITGTNTGYDPQLNNADATSFYGLTAGIRSVSLFSDLGYYQCRYYEFELCAYGIVNFYTDNILVYENNFYLPDLASNISFDMKERGMHLSHSTAYIVEQNYFTYQETPDKNGLGIWVEQSGEHANQIRNNDFNRLEYGVYAKGINADEYSNNSGGSKPITRQVGLQLLCNTFTAGEIDIYRAAYTTMRSDQGGNQDYDDPDGNEVIFPAGNVFSQDFCNAPYYGDWVDHQDQTWEIDYKHWQFAPNNEIPECAEGSEFEISMLTAVNSCVDSFPPYGSPPSGGVPYGGGRSAPDLYTDYQNAKSSFESEWQVYLSIVDDNKTSDSKTTIANAFPEESAFVRDLLLERTPLSDNVMRELVAEGSKFDPWHLTQVFMANGPLTASLLSDLDDSGLLSPFYMALVENAGDEVSQRKLMEQQLAAKGTKMGNLRNQVFFSERHSAPWSDTMVVDFSTGRLLLASDSTLSSAQRLLAQALQFNDLTASSNLVSTYPELQFMADADSLDYHLSQTDSVPSSTVNSLWNISQSDTSSRGQLALAYLHGFNATAWLPVPEAGAEPKSLSSGGKEEKEEPYEIETGLWPNPATHRVVVTYPKEMGQGGLLRIYDPTGAIHFESDLEDTGAMEVNLEHLETGLYFVQLEYKSVMVETLKLVVHE